MTLRFADLRLGMKLALSMGLLLALVLGIAAAGVARLDAVNARHAEDVADRRGKASMVNAVIEEFRDMSAAVHAALIVDAEPELARQLERVDAGKKKVGELLETLDRAMAADDAEAKAMLQAVHDRNAGYLVGLTRFTRLLDAGKASEAKTLLNRELTRQLQDSYRAMQELRQAQSARIDRGQAAAADAYRRARLLVAGVGAAALVLSLLVAVWIARRITAPLSAAVHVAHQVASGDLSGIVQAAGEDETGQLMRALGAMNTSLTRIVSEVRATSDALANAAEELAAGNSHLLQRTEEQASSLEESATSMEQLTATVKQNAADAHQASQLARQASEVAARGGTVMGEVVKTMADIRESARRVEDISGVINGIAFQTNILALNAAVEAARAGHQGRGFAVVASEVRALAQRSAEAAKEIKALIADSGAKVTQGSRLVDEAGRTMEEIVAGIGKVTELTGHISNASREQSTGIDQLNQALSEMERMTQQNAGLAEQSAAAMESLSEQAHRLVEAVGVFRLSAYGGPSSSAPSLPTTHSEHGHPRLTLNAG